MPCTGEFKVRSMFNILSIFMYLNSKESSQNKVTFSDGLSNKHYSMFTFQQYSQKLKNDKFGNLAFMTKLFTAFF